MTKRLERLRVAIQCIREEIKSREDFVNKHGWTLANDEVLTALKETLAHLRRRRGAKSLNRMRTPRRTGTGYV